MKAVIAFTDSISDELFRSSFVNYRWNSLFRVWL